jgi:hypothetical protein
MGLAVLSLLVFGVWAGLAGWMAGKNLDRSQLGPNIDWDENPEFGGLCVSPGSIRPLPDLSFSAVLYFIYGGIYVAYPLAVQWILACALSVCVTADRLSLTAALTNSPTKLARFSGLFKGTVAAGMTVW